jgi:PAT family beta-lactamase induction signal transducer AmpG
MGLSNATIGLVGGFIVLPLPQMLAAQGVPELKIAVDGGLSLAACALMATVIWRFARQPTASPAAS